ncbi:Secreted protein [Frankia sp. AiPs1]|uniref:DUF2345 domain-containing protein n=1 Tax=Frankia sp. AiPa1 TaxID=573492 RepID=UPI00202AE263|nr:DUF2345 domain-containing protein [Frankia sp. AiPa1]MCL9762307.1 DUF2345 domain-containing protein [Frankia sp. AiPa1]
MTYFASPRRCRFPCGGDRYRGATRGVSRFVAGGATIAMTGLFALGGAHSAQAGASIWASCPGGRTTEVREPGTTPAARGGTGGPDHVNAGYYASIGTRWPPTTYQLCRTKPAHGPKAGRPAVKILHQGCPNGLVTFGVPRPAGGTGTGGPPVTWGTFLPSGWYDLSVPPSGVPGWTALCWSPNKPTKGHAHHRGHAPTGRLSIPGVVTLPGSGSVAVTAPGSGSLSVTSKDGSAIDVGPSGISIDGGGITLGSPGSISVTGTPGSVVIGPN